MARIQNYIGDNEKGIFQVDETCYYYRVGAFYYNSTKPADYWFYEMTNEEFKNYPNIEINKLKYSIHIDAKEIQNFEAEEFYVTFKEKLEEKTKQSETLIRHEYKGAGGYNVVFSINDKYYYGKEIMSGRSGMACNFPSGYTFYKISKENFQSGEKSSSGYGYTFSKEYISKKLKDIDFQNEDFYINLEKEL